MKPLKKIFKNALAAGVFITVGAITSHASYTIARTDGGSLAQIVAGRQYDMVIQNTDSPLKLQDVVITLTIGNFDISPAPGVQTGSNKYSLDSNGFLHFPLTVYQTGNFSMTVNNSQDPSNKQALTSVQVVNFPTQFAITPGNPVVHANVPFNVTITAEDGSGTAVLPFEDTIQVVDSQLHTVTIIDGSQFKNGQVQSTITIRAADLNNQFTLTITNGVQYKDASHNVVPTATTTTSLINLIPDVFAKLLLLFPGESLTPGVGKIGTPTLQVSLEPVAISVLRVDQYFNPLLGNPASPINVVFDSSQEGQPSAYGGPDNPPFPRTEVMSGANIFIPSFSNKIYFGGAGPRAVTVTPDGDSSKSDVSNINVNAGKAESYTVTLVGVGQGSTITTDSIVRVEIRAFDQHAVQISTLFGRIANATLSAQVGGNENIAWVDTDVTTDIPDNDIVFSGGLAVLNINVTKFGNNARLHFVTPDGDTYSATTFNVDTGAPNRILLTVVGKASNPTQGEIYSPGTYPGNSGTPPVVTAGEDVIVEARVTDRRWNLISGGGSAYHISIRNNLPNHYLVATQSPNVTGTAPFAFPSNGEFAYDSNPAFDKSFRVHFRTAGPSSLVPAPQMLATSDINPAVQFLSSPMTVLPAGYSNLVVVAPGETLRPGIDNEFDGKQGTTTVQLAGVSFNVTAYATDQYFNPIINGPFPNVTFGISPSLLGSFVSGSLPAQMVAGSRPFTITLQDNSQLQLSDVGTPSIQQTVSIPVTAGLLDHFAMDAITSPQQAGMPFTSTIKALDKFGNVAVVNSTVTLTPNTGATTMSPASVTLQNGIFTGNFTMFAATPTAQIMMSNPSSPSATRSSNQFVVQVSPQGYKKVLLLLPGETIFPGTATGKTPATPNPIADGLIFTGRVIACDPYYNPLTTTASVMLSSNHLAQFGQATGDFVIGVNGYSEYSTPVTLKNAVLHTIVAQDANDSTVGTSSSVIQGLIGGYKKLQILADGETNNPDVPAGKTGTPNPEKVSTPFNITINAVDDNWNIVNTFNGGDTDLSASISAVLFLPPNNVGATNPRPFVNGSVVRQTVIGQQGTITISALDDANLTKPGANVDVVVNPGPVYVFHQTPTKAVAGQAFAPFSITLEDNGTPLAGYNRSVFLTAALTSGSPASGSFNANNTPREYVMNNGAVTISDLTYGYSESIEIKLQDEFNRVGFSTPIAVVPSGLKYIVSVPSMSVVGLPTEFPVTVQLFEQNTNTLVKNHDHTFSVQVLSADSTITAGSQGTAVARFNQGVVTFPEHYTKAENILVKIIEAAVADGGDPDYTIPSSNSVPLQMIPDKYIKLLLIAPNETQVAGVISATGKTGTPAFQQKGVPFLMQVRGVDQYWNTVSQYQGPSSIMFQSNDLPPSIQTGNPVNQGAALNVGASAANIKLFNPGDTQITVSDTANPNIASQTDLIRVGGLFYQIDGEPSQQLTGTQFNISVTLFDSNTSQPVSSANQTFQVKAKLQDGTDATGLLGITSGQLTNGTANIVGETYSIAENIYLNITDSLGNSGSSDVISFVPRQVRYEISAPTQAIVNQPFLMSVQTFDAFTGTPVKNFNRVIQVSAISSLTGTPVTGSLTPTTVSINSGIGMANLIYTIAEPISLQVTDNTPLSQSASPTTPTFQQAGSINVHPGPLATIDGISDFTMQSNEEKTFNLTLRDRSGNPIPGQRLKFSMQTADPTQIIGINGDTNAPSLQANGQGQLSVRFTPTRDTNGRVEITMSDDSNPNGYSTLLVVTVLGLGHRPEGALDIGADRIPVNSSLQLPIRVTASPTTLGVTATIKTFYRLGDTGAFQVYDPTGGALGFTETKTYKVEWYSEVCYDAGCTSPVMEFSSPDQFNTLNVTTYKIDDSISGYPSPFNPKGPADENFITIQYPLAQASSVEINIYDLMGHKVWHKDIDAGQEGGLAKTDNRVFWFGTNDEGTVVANGGYITTVKVGATGQTMRTKILVVK